MIRMTVLQPLVPALYNGRDQPQCTVARLQEAAPSPATQVTRFLGKRFRLSVESLAAGRLEALGRGEDSEEGAPVEAGLWQKSRNRASSQPWPGAVPAQSQWVHPDESAGGEPVAAVSACSHTSRCQGRGLTDDFTAKAWTLTWTALKSVVFLPHNAGPDHPRPKARWWEWLKGG